MIIASVTLSSNREAIIADALRSVPWVDLAIIIDLGITDRTLDVARDIVGDKIRVVPADPGLSTGHLRNLGNDAAQMLGATWACTLDTDERIRIRPRCDIRSYLSHCHADVILAHDAEHRYTKERFFRIPAVTRWSGHCHEGATGGIPDYCPDVTFSELTKSPEGMHAKMIFVRDEMQAALLADHLAGRYWYHLGDALAWLDDQDGALNAFMHCINLHQAPADVAWSCYRAALIHAQREQWQAGIDLCVQGLAAHPGYAELAWLAGVLCLQLGQPLNALLWARMAQTNGLAQGIGEQIPRLFISSPVGLWEGPYEVVRLAQEALGNHRASATAARLRDQVRERRLRVWRQSVS